ncbi:hypothetical protein WISP_102371 [Willisornis vidua]|uniref:Uncharacterized protein n=1 Tax=Willisornis vidua TaxID=1566151 RepID=A0ABQ9D413_9PASS|nr:hypothetical protein WISP_102371 [Willisornis vidua]
MNGVSPRILIGGQSGPLVAVNMAKAEVLFQGVLVSLLRGSSLAAAGGKFTIQHKHRLSNLKRAAENAQVDGFKRKSGYKSGPRITESVKLEEDDPTRIIEYNSWSCTGPSPRVTLCVSRYKNTYDQMIMENFEKEH